MCLFRVWLCFRSVWGCIEYFGLVLFVCRLLVSWGLVVSWCWWLLFNCCVLCLILVVGCGLCCFWGNLVFGCFMSV